MPLFLSRFAGFMLSLSLTLALPACSEPVPEQVTKSVDSSALACVAEAIYFEARGTGAEGRRAVAEVIVNRAADARFPATPCAVVDQRTNGACQFSYRCDGLPDDRFVDAAAYARAQATAAQVLADPGTRITDGALYFHAASAAPGWFATRRYIGVFGGNKFYR